MRNILWIALALGVVSCAPDGVNEKKEKLRKYKEQVSEFNQKIETLQMELDSSSTEESVKNNSVAVEVKKIKPEVFASYFEATGKVEAVRDAYISPEVNGQVSEILVERGDLVDKGDLMIRLNTDVTRNNIEEVKTNLALAEKVFEKQKSLWEKEIGSEMQYLEARNRKESLEARLATLESQLKMAYIYASFPGIIEEINIKQGEIASPGMRLIRLVNLNELRITSDVSEAFMENVEKGDAVQIKFPSLPGDTLIEKVSRIGSVIDPVTRTFKVEVLTKNRNHRLKPNMLSSIKIQDYLDRDAMLVPSIILKDDFKGTFLFKLEESDDGPVAVKTYVDQGRTVQDMTKIKRGIDIGDRVITKGYNLVTDGARVRIID